MVMRNGNFYKLAHNSKLRSRSGFWIVHISSDVIIFKSPALHLGFDLSKITFQLFAPIQK